MIVTEEKPVQILELFGGIGSPRCALRNLGIPTKAIQIFDRTGMLAATRVHRRRLRESESST